MLPSYLLLDLETTGGDPVRDRITEIAAIRFDGGRETARWQSLVDPGRPIPPFIQRLTGISDAMVAGAPAFEQLLDTLLPLLEGAVLVAHNVRFDHGFLKNALARAGVEPRLRTLCTVRLSRRLEPQHSGHGLDAIMRRHGLVNPARHRALGDVLVLRDWLERMRELHGEAALAAHAQALLQAAASLPPQLRTDVSTLPEGPGVYLFHGEGEIPLYIGKSVNLRRRVLSHFQADHRDARETRLSQELRRVEVRETAGELGALLLEARLVKQLQPLFNRKLRRDNQLCSWRLAADPAQRPLLTLVRGEELDPEVVPSLYGTYRSRRQALQSLRDLADAQGLCQRLLGLESGTGRCFAHQLGRCRGACCGEESPQRHALRVQAALASERLRAWPWSGPVGLREVSDDGQRSDLHVFDQWRHLGTVHDEAELEDLLRERRAGAGFGFDLDTYRLLLAHLARPGRAQPLPLRAARADPAGIGEPA
ncbi:3'-5' exonuclease family protein [Thiomonas sp. FB-6]|uniref:3'-5' exonuclease family protein n=1 Tax=Thiomonas sp. FB-6 TaxID=1158291 RepID=UPI00036BB91E|nr:3'-5' exonuclease family protein [Thiomonas sp. FB-6]